MMRVFIGGLFLALACSCGKTCDKQQGELPVIDLSSYKPDGEYRWTGMPAGIDTVPVLSIHGDSAIMTYKRNGKTWKLHYKISLDTTHEKSGGVYE